MRTKENDKFEKREETSSVCNGEMAAKGGSRRMEAMAGETTHGEVSEVTAEAAPEQPTSTENGGVAPAGSGEKGDGAPLGKTTIAAGGEAVATAYTGSNGVSGWAQIYPDLSRIEYEVTLSTSGTPSRTFKNVYIQINMYEGASLVTSFWMKNYGNCFVEADSSLTLKGTITPANLRYPDDMRLIYNNTCYLDITSDYTMEHILLQKRP